MWHVDQYDKLRHYGFCIHGAIDGLSQERSSIADNELDPTENKITKITKGVVTDPWYCLLRRFNLVEISYIRYNGNARIP